MMRSACLRFLILTLAAPILAAGVAAHGWAQRAPNVSVNPAQADIPPSQALTLTVNVSGGNGNPIPTGSVTVMSNNPPQVVYDTFQYPDGTLINGLTAQSGNSAWTNLGNGIGEVEGFHLLNAAPSGEAGNLYATLANTSTLNGSPQPITTIGGTIRMCPPASGTYNPANTSEAIVASHDLTLGTILAFEFGPSGWWLYKQVNGVATTLLTGSENVPDDCATEYTVQMIINQAAGTVQVIPPDGIPAPVVTDSDVTTIDAQYGVWNATNNAPNNYIGEWGSVWLGGGYVSESTLLSGGSASIEIPASSLALGMDTLTVTYTPDADSASLYTVARGSSSVTVENQASGSVPPKVTVQTSPANINLAKGATVTVGISGPSGSPAPTGTAMLRASVGSGSFPAIYDTFQYPDGTLINGLTAQSGNSEWTGLGPGIGEVEGYHLLNAAPSGEGENLYATLPNTSTISGTPQAITTIGGTIRMCPSAAGTYDPTYTSVGMIAAHDLSLASFIEIGFGPVSWWLNKQVNSVVTPLGSGSENLPVDCSTEYTVQMIINQAAGTLQVIPPNGIPSAVITDPDITQIDAQYGVWEPEDNAPYKYIGEWGSVWMGGSYLAPAAVLSGGNATFNILSGSLPAGDVTLTASYIPDAQSWSAYRAATGTGAISVSLVTPVIAITPAESAITTAQPVTVTLAVTGGSGEPTPTGSVTLSGPGFTSQATQLLNGSATVVTPAGSLAVGTDTLTASYTPDAQSAPFYDNASQTGVITVIPPAFTLTASPATLSEAPGGNVSSTISVTGSGGFAGQVALTASGLPSGVTASFLAGSAPGTQTVTFIAAASVQATTTAAVVTILGTSGTLTSKTQIALSVNVQPAFTLTASPLSLSITPGGNVSSTISVTGSGGFAGQVALTASGLPSGVTASFLAGSAPGSQVVTFTAAASVQATTTAAVVTILGTSGTLTSKTQIALSVNVQPAFTLTASPLSLSITPGGTASSAISVTGSGEFAGQVALTASGLPSGVTASFLAGSAPGSQVVTFTAAASVQATTTAAVVTILGTSGTLTSKTQIALSVNVQPAFTLTASPLSLSITPGGTASSTISVTGSGGFSGQVSLTASGLPSGVTATFLAGSAPGSQVVTFTVAASTPATTSSAVVTILGTSGTLSSKTQIALNITVEPAFTLTASSSSLSITPGGTASSTVSITGSGGFLGQVSLTASGLPSGVTASFAAGSSAGTQMVTFTVAAAAPATTTAAVVTILGTSGTLTATTEIALSITAAPGLAGSGAGTKSISIAAGATTGNTVTIGVVGTNGFAGTVNLSCAVASKMVNLVDPPQCSLNPDALTISGDAAQNSTLTVTTMAPSTASNRKPVWLPAGSTVLALLVLLIVPRSRRRWPLLLAILAFGGVIGVIGCGGSASNNKKQSAGNSGTTPGAYTITVSGASGSLSTTVATINLTVQ